MLFGHDQPGELGSGLGGHGDPDPGIHLLAGASVEEGVPGGDPGAVVAAVEGSGDRPIGLGRVRSLHGDGFEENGAPRVAPVVAIG